MSLDLRVIRREREPQDTCQRGNIIGPVDSAKRGALVRHVPPAEEPTESAANKRQWLIGIAVKVSRGVRRTRHFRSEESDSLASAAICV